MNKEKVMEAARKFVDKGQIDKAVKEYQRIVEADPKDVRVWLKIGDLYAKKGAKQEAIDTYLKVARFYHEQGFFLKAVAVYKQILKLDPRLVDVILKLAELYRQLGLMSDAMQHFESVAAHFHREGNTKEALETVKKLVDLDPENIATRIKLAELYSKEGLVEEASTEFTVACEQLRRQNRQDDFVKVAERLLWHKPDNHALNRELAGLYLRRNDPRRALQKLQACFKADPRDVETLGLLAQAFQALDQKAKTVSVLKELAKIHVDNKARDKAAEVHRKILEFVPNDPDAMQFLGVSAPPPLVPAATAPPPPSRAPAPPPPPPMAARGPQAPMRASTPIPTMGQTPMPAGVRGATANAQFNITSDLPAMPASSRMTGSMPLVDEQSLSGVDFALPEYDDGDFSADMEPPPDPRRASAAGERHSEEISKILAETDVYVKYGLHQKAVDHLRRVFTLDGENVEAHERLKEIFVSQGREQEAEGELLKLAELVASGDPDRAEAYLQELLAMNGTHTGAFELARRFRLRVARMSSVSSEVEYQSGGVAPVDGDDELDLSAAPPVRGVGVARGGSPPHARDSIDDFDPDEIIGGAGGNGAHAQHANGNGMAHGSPPPARPPGPPAQSRSQPMPVMPSMPKVPKLPPKAATQPVPMQAKPMAEENFELDFEPSPSQSTRQMSPDHAAQLAQMEEIDDPVLAEPPKPASSNRWQAQPAARPAPQQQYEYDQQQQAVDEQLDDAALGEDIDQQVAAELGGIEDLPFDPDEARAFDTAMKEPTYGVSGYEETDLPRGHDDMAIAGGYDPYGTDSTSTPQTFDPTASHAAAPEEDIPVELASGPVSGPANARAESHVEDELDEADFYISQGMYPEALETLQELLSRYPNHKLITAKLREVQAMSQDTPAGGGHEVGEDELGDPIEVVDGNDSQANDAPEGTDAIDIDEMMPLEEEEAPRGRQQPRRVSVMLEKPVEEGDGETHYDLGLAYKEMGLWDEAIKEFEKSVEAPGREVQAHLMIGMCFREQGNAAESINQFKAALHGDGITETEQLSVYYEIGLTYEAIGDASEAFYYFELVTKRDPTFADASQRAAALRPRVGRQPRRVHADDEI
nr:tetratricopeptide repeat protein [Kofleriaceae bacterium]